MPSMTSPQWQGLGPRPTTSFKYQLRREVPTTSPEFPTCDNLVLACPGSSAMSSAAGVESRKETPFTIDDLAK
jgi:hypothetical protein